MYPPKFDNRGVILDGFQPTHDFKETDLGKVEFRVKGHTHRVVPEGVSRHDYRATPVRTRKERDNFQFLRRCHRIRRDHPGVASAVEHLIALAPLFR